MSEHSASLCRIAESVMGVFSLMMAAICLDVRFFCFNSIMSSIGMYFGAYFDVVGRLSVRDFTLGSAIFAFYLMDEVLNG